MTLADISVLITFLRITASKLTNFHANCFWCNGIATYVPFCWTDFGSSQ